MRCVWEQSKKAVAIKSLVRREFEKGREETDPDQIENLKAKYVAPAQLNPAMRWVWWWCMLMGAV